MTGWCWGSEVDSWGLGGVGDGVVAWCGERSGF